MAKKDQQANQLKHTSGGGQIPGTNWGMSPGDATNRSPKKAVPAGKRTLKGEPDSNDPEAKTDEQ